MIEFYASNKLLVWLAAILLSMLVCLVYYLFFGSHMVSKEEKPPILIKRLGTGEWISHWLILLGFLVLAVTGIVQILPGYEPLHLGPFHGWLGVVFLIIVLVTFIKWIPDAIFKRYDWPWLLKLGGYLSRQPEQLPAGRFNAGQKIYYWSIFLVVIGLLVSGIFMEQGSSILTHSPEGRKEFFWCIHGLLGCLASAMVIGHGFLSVFVNPDAAGVLWSGKISKAYTDYYHSLWIN